MKKGIKSYSLGSKMNNQPYEPWYEKVARIDNQQEREEYIRGAFGNFSNKQSGPNPFSIGLGLTTLLYALGGIFTFFKRSQQNNEQPYDYSNLQNDPLLIQGSKDIVRKQEIESLKRDCSYFFAEINKIEDSYQEDIFQVYELAEWKELIDIVPREYKLLIEKKFELMSELCEKSIRHKEDFVTLNHVPSDQLDFILRNLQKILQEIVTLSNEFQDASKAADEKINDWLQKNESTVDGKRAKHLINQMRL